MITPVENPPPPRAEREHVEFPGISWTAFDRYARYGAVAGAIAANLGPGAHRALDVGDNSGYLRAFSPDLDVTSIDVGINEQPLPGTRLVLGDGTRLPVADRCADVVVSCDALEHVPPAQRGAFLEELVRCSNDLVVVAAPFDTPGVAGSEELVRRFVGAATGSPQPQLAEHAEHGLPSLAESQRHLEALGMQVATVGNGNLQDWVLGMLVKHQVVGRGGFLDLDIGFDVFYNLALQHRSRIAPFYRHVLVARRTATPEVGQPAADDQPMLDSTPLLAALLTAAPGTTGVLGATAALQTQQSEAFSHLMQRLDGVESALQHLMLRFDGADGALQLLMDRSEPRAAQRGAGESRLSRVRARVRGFVR